MHPFCMQLRYGGGLRAKGTVYRLELLIARMRRRGYLLSDFPNIVSLAEEADRRLFKSIIQYQIHVLRHLFTSPPTKPAKILLNLLNFSLKRLLSDGFNMAAIKSLS